MYGWRAKIGLIKPTLRGKGFALWYERAPEGVEILPTYVGYRRGERADFDKGLARMEELADDLRAAGAEALCISGGPPFLLRGREFEVGWTESLEHRLGMPVIGPLRPHVDALVGLGAKRVLVATYYKEQLNEAIVRYLAERGIDGRVAGYPGEGREEMYSIPLRDVERLTWTDVYRHCRSALLEGGFDALYIHGHGWDAERAVKPLELDLGTPVVFGPLAEMVETYRRLTIAFSLD